MLITLMHLSSLAFAAAADKGKGKAKPVFAWGKAKEAADLLTGLSSGAST